MGYAELIERLQALPQDKQAEVFDLVEFLSQRNGSALKAPLSQGEWIAGEFSEYSMAQALRGIEHDPVCYTAADLRERWQ